MNHTLRKAGQAYQRGSVAVETAIVFSFLVMFATAPSIYWAFYFYQYSAAQKAVHHAALYLATAPKVEMAVEGPDGEPLALAVARKIIATEMAGMGAPEPDFGCNYRQASGTAVPKTCNMTNALSTTQTLVQVNVAINMSYIDPLTGDDSGLWISPYALVPYIGN
ncbi:MAG: TadE family protein [Pseudomonadota bacterium]